MTVVHGAVWRLPDEDTSTEDASLDAQQAHRSAKRGRAAITLWGHSNTVTCAEWVGASNAGVATASWDRSVLLYDVGSSSTAPVRTLVGHDGPLTSVAAARSSSLLLTASRDCTARSCGRAVRAHAADLTLGVRWI